MNGRLMVLEGTFTPTICSFYVAAILPLKAQRRFRSTVPRRTAIGCEKRLKRPLFTPIPLSCDQLRRIRRHQNVA